MLTMVDLDEMVTTLREELRNAEGVIEELRDDVARLERDNEELREELQEATNEVVETRELIDDIRRIMGLNSAVDRDEKILDLLMEVDWK